MTEENLSQGVSVTGTKTTIYWTEATCPIVRYWKSRGWDIQQIVNTAVVIFNGSNSTQRDAAQAIAQLGTNPTISETAGDKDFREQMVDLARRIAELPVPSSRGRRARIAKVE